MPTQTIVHQIGFASIPYISGGDADVNSKSGRSTEVQLEITGLALTADKRSITCQVLYRVSELRPDHTTLALEREIRIPVPDNLQVTKIVNTSEFRKQWTVSGQIHSELWIGSNLANSCLEFARYRIDGSGRDDQGNAALSLLLSIDVELAA